MSLLSKIEEELTGYFDTEIPLSENIYFSQHKMVKRIALFDNRSYGSGKKLDKQGRYKYWFDIETQRSGTEIKNIDFDTKDPRIYSDRTSDDFAVLIANSALEERLHEKGDAERLNDMVEQYTTWGNVVAKKIKGDYEVMDLKNLFVINQTAKTLNDSPVIERHVLTASDIRAKEGLWMGKIDEILELKSMFFSPTPDVTSTQTNLPYYEVFERNGEVTLADLKEAQGGTRNEKDEKEYVLAKVIVVGVDRGVTTGKVVFAEKISEMPYKEAHRGRYKGRWLREGMIELLMDVQVRANEIGNQVARGLEMASKTIFTASDRVIANNILTGMRNGDIVRSADFHHVEIRMGALDQLIAEWNRLMALADGIANSREISQGEALPSGTPFRLGALYNQNANKLFDFLREKLGIFFTDIIDGWTLPEIIKELKTTDVVRFLGDTNAKMRLATLAVESWYMRNLYALPPHDAQTADFLKQQEMQKILSSDKILVKLTSEMFKDFQPYARVIITGENVALAAKKESLATFAGMEMDPVRRSFIIEKGMVLDGWDPTSWPKTPAQQLMPQPGGAPNAPAPVGAKAKP